MSNKFYLFGPNIFHFYKAPRETTAFTFKRNGLDAEINIVQKVKVVKMALQPRKFNFFDREVVKDPTTNQIFETLKPINISTCVSGRGQLVIGDYEGNIHLLPRTLQLMSFSAYHIRVSHLYQMKQSNLLISIGEDEQGINPLIKVWNLDKMDQGTPLCTRLCRAVPDNKPVPVTCFTVHENLNWMAIGFENGSVLVFKGDVKSDRHSKQTVVYQSSKPITGLAFKSIGKSVILFIATEIAILSLNLTAKNAQPLQLDDFGCKLGCSVMSDFSQDNHFVIAREDALYFYQPDGRGPCLAYEGEKFMLHWFRGYLVIVGRDSKQMLSNVPIIHRSGQNLDMHMVTVYDIQNKFIAYSAAHPDVISVVSEWGYLYVLAGDRKLYQLQEKDTQTKLEMLFNKANYEFAISLAKSQQYHDDGLVDIYTQYGDHLYRKGNHDGAINQYIKTIGKLEASYVIRKFLDAQRIHNLTKYLQALHKAGLATEEHTTLLLNCYTKLKDDTKLDEFIKTKDRDVDTAETAIKVCRQAGYHKHALFLANKHNLHEWYLKIQLDDIKDYQEALEYIGKLDFEEAEKNLEQYGKILMSHRPEETTALLKRLCTDYKPTDRPLVEDGELDGGTPTRSEVCRSQPDKFIHIFVDNSAKLTEFLEHMISVSSQSSSILYNTLIELYLHDVAHMNGAEAKVKEEKILAVLKNPDANYDLDQALVLCQMNSFKAGILCLYEKARLYQQILRYHMDNDAYDLVITTCKTYGNQDSNLWVQALSYFAKKENLKQQLGIVLHHIDKMNLLPPLLVIQTLANSPTATLSVIKNYVIRKLQTENDQIADDERLIKQYQEDTAKKRQQIEDLKTKAKVFQNTKCSICNNPLELPTVHFLCEPHSFHQPCLLNYADNENECPVCSNENRKIMDVIRQQEHGRDLHETFHNQLERSVHDGFSVVADYFGRGVFNKVTLITDSPARIANMGGKYQQ